MNERGIYGLRKNGKDKCTYNQNSSYPKALGSSIIRFCKENSIEELNKLYDNITLVEEFDKPTKTQLNNLDRLGLYDKDRTIISDFWYFVLQSFQGGLNKFKEYSDKYGLVYMINQIVFIEDSSYIQYGYIINLDSNVLEFWVGNQKEEAKQNRYGKKPYKDSGFYPCKKVLKIPLEEIQTNTVEETLNKLNNSLK